MTEWVHAALAKWAGFPVDREPRPIVLTGQSPQESDAELREVVVRLAAPPGNRVLVSARTGAARTVVRAG